MKRLLTVLSAIASLVCVNAQVPQSMSYQAVIRDNASELVTNHSVGIQVSILQGSSTGTAVYVETHATTTNDNGLVTFEIGSGTPSAGTMSNIDWATSTFFIKTEIDPSGGASYTITGTSQILSVPYALFAKAAETSAESDGLRHQIKILEDNLIAAGTYRLADIEGNQYDVVKIGTQVWMKENLKTTKYNDGTAIPNITDNSAWSVLSTGAYSDYNNTASYSTTYGRLYNWYAVDNEAATKLASNGGKNVCPTGWHIPTDAEWTSLTNYLTNNGYGYEGSGDDIGKSLANTSGWISDPTAGNVGNDQANNNSSGFTALPGGLRYVSGQYDYVGTGGFWWSSEGYPTTSAFGTYAHGRYMGCNGSYLNGTDKSKQGGLSVRCLRD